MENAPKYKMLVIDEDLELHEHLEILLKPFQYEITSSLSYSQGLDLALEGQFDLILIELEYPKSGQDGLSLLQNLTEKRPESLVMVASAQPDVRRCVQAINYGAKEYFHKPLDPEVLFAALDRRFKSSHAKAAQNLLLDATADSFDTAGSYRNASVLFEIEDFDEMLNTGLDLFTKEVDALAAVLWMQDRPPQGPLNIKRARGLIDVAAEKQTWKLDEVLADTGIDPRNVDSEPQFDPRKEGDAGRQNIWFPLRLEDDRLGMLKISEPSEGVAFDDKAVRLAGLIGNFFQLALTNHFRLMKAERRLVESHSTLAYNLMYFSDLVNKEVRKSLRYHRLVSMIHLRVENFKQIRSQFNENEYESAVRKIMEAARVTLRDADLIGRADDSNYFLLLPETDYFGSLICIHRIRRAAMGLSYISDDNQSLPIHLSFASGTFPTHGKTFEELQAATEEKLEGLKRSIYRRMSLEDRTFKQMLDRLVGPAEAYAPIQNYLARMKKDANEPPLVLDEALGQSEDEAGLNRHFIMSEDQMIDVWDLLAREINFYPSRRGILYIGHESIDPENRLLAPFKGVKKNETSVYVLGRVQSGVAGLLSQEVTLVSLSAKQAKPFIYAVYLNEDYCYAMAARRDANGRHLGLHTSDPVLVEHMIGKIQDEYVLQKGI